MKYILLMYEIERNASLLPEELAQFESRRNRLMRAAEIQGTLLGNELLKSIETATTLFVSNGNRRIIDAPFEETRHQLTGYYLLECKDLDEAIEWGWQIPMIYEDGEGCVEIRPVHDSEC